MNYDYVLIKLEELMVELIEKKISISPQIMEDFKSARSLSNILKNDPVNLDTALDITPYLQKTEAALLFLADSEVSKEYADQWQQEIIKAYTQECVKTPLLKTNFVSGIPKGEHWVRIKTSEFINETEGQELLEKFNLSAKQQEDGYLLVHGKKENVMCFLKEVRNKVSKNK